MTIHIEIPKDNIYVEKQNISIIPKGVSGIYKFYNENNQLVYLGKAKALRQRIGLHLSGKDSTTGDIYRNFKFVACIYVEDPVHRDIYETYMINSLQPLLNWGKVYTYESKKYNPTYNPIHQLREEFLQKQMDEVLKNFEI